MSRKFKKGIIGTRSPQDALSDLRSSLVTLKALTSLYDSGHFDSYREISASIRRIILEELVLANINESTLHLISFARNVDEDNILPQWRLFGFRVNATPLGDGPDELTFIPNCQMDKEPTSLSFNEWWSEAVYIDGAGIEHLPYKHRRKVRRSELIDRIRNEVGAHFDGDVSSTYDFVSSWKGVIRFSGKAESIHIMNTMASAAVRNIAEEVLISDLPNQLAEHLRL